jgi:hypothetical protein
MMKSPPRWLNLAVTQRQVATVSHQHNASKNKMYISLSTPRNVVYLRHILHTFVVEVNNKDSRYIRMWCLLDLKHNKLPPRKLYVISVVP